MKIRQKKSKVLFSAHIKKTLALSPYKVKKQIIFPCIYEELVCGALPWVAIGVTAGKKWYRFIVTAWRGMRCGANRPLASGGGAIPCAALLPVPCPVRTANNVSSSAPSAGASV